jgi:hypothetical protein
MADIKDVAASIKQALTSDPDRDLEFLARLFEDDSMTDAGAGNELSNRLTTILAASSNGANNGVTHFAGIYTGCHDLGFRTEFKDPWGRFSDNQVGHFTTAVDMGFRPSQTFAALPWWARAFVFIGTSGAAQAAAPEDICIRLIIGHEQVADNATNAFQEQATSATETEVGFFEGAIDTVTSALNQDTSSASLAMKDIRVGQGQGNSRQDLLLSCFGYKFGKMIRSGTIDKRAYAARWVRSNIGGVRDRDGIFNDGVQPPSGTAFG